MESITYQPALRPSLPCIYGCLDHREFCVRLTDSPLLQWFLHVGQVDSVKVSSKTTSARFSTWATAGSLHIINEKLTALPGADGSNVNEEDAPSAAFGLPAPITCDEAFFDSTCLKADIHFPVDWVLLRDATRTLMKATVLIRGAALKNRMPQEPLEFLSDMNTLGSASRCCAK